MPETSAYSTEDLRRYQERYGLEPTTTSNKGNPPITAPNAIEDLRRYQERYGLEPLATPKAPTPPRDPFSETFSALGAGVVSTAEGLAGTAEMIGIPGAGSVRKKMQEVNESDMLRRPDYLATETVWEKPERLGDWRWWVRSLGENLPNMATMMLPGVGAARAAKAASWGSKALFNVGKSVVTGERAAGLAGAWTGSMALESGSAYGQAKDEMTKAGTYDADTIERIATLEGVAAGTANSLLELLPFDNLFLKQAGADRFLKRIVRQSFLEGSTEAAQEAVNIYVEKLGHKPDQLLSDNIGRMLESAIVGGALGGAAGATLGTHEHRSNVKQYNALGEELGVTPKIYAMKEAGMSDPNIATALDSWIKTIRTKMEQKPKGADAMTTGGSEVKDAARKPTIPEIDAEEMVSYLLYGDGKYTPPPGVFGQAAKATTTRAKKGVLGIFGMKEKVPAGETAMPPDASTGSARTDVNPAEGPTAADLGTLATGAVAGKDIALKEPLVQKIDEAKKAEIRQEGQSTFDLTLGDITLEDQEKLEEARQRELLVKQQAVEQEAAAIATQAQSTLAQAAADTAAVGKEISGGDPAKQALVAQVMALSDRVVQTKLQKKLGLDVRPAGQDMYAILTADGEKSVPMVELRKLLANKLVANYDAAQVAQANAAKQHLVDVATAQKRSEEARIQKEAAIATQALASTRETLQMGRTTTPQQMELLQASRDKLTPAEIAKLDARVAAVQGQAAAAQEQQAAVVPEPVQEIQAAAAQVVPSNALQMLGARRDIPVVPVEEGPAPLSAAQDEAVPDAQVIEELLRIMTSQLANTSTGGLITNKDGEKKWMAQGGWISETAKSFRNQSTTQLRDAKGKPVTANIDVARLKTIFKRARNEEQLTEQEQTILTVALRAAHAEETQARKTIEEAAAAQANSAAADDFNPREFAGSETPTTEAEPSTRETILQTAVDRGEIDSFNDTGAWIGDAFIPDARLKVLKDRSVAAAGTSPPSPAVALASGVNFGGNIRAADAAALVDHAHVLRAERQTTGQKEITALGKDGISALAEKATDGDFESLAKLDSLLADVTGGPGSFYKTGNWGADHYVKALGKYLPALPDMGKSTPSQSVALATGQKKVVPEKAAAVSTEPAWMQTRDKYIQSARDPEKTKDRDRQWGALQSLLQKNQDEGKREGLITTNQWRTFVDKFGDPDTVSNDRFHFFDDPQGMGKIVKGAALTEERQHRQAVADAVAQGENIPDEVKGDYPDLFPKTGESAPPSPAVALAAGQKTAAAVTTGGQDQIDRLDALITAKRESLNSVLVAFDKLTDPEKQKKNIVQRNNIVRDIQSLESQRQKYVDAMPDAPAPTSSNAVKLATGQKVTAPAVAAIPVSKVAEETVTTPKEQKAYVIDKLDGLIDAARENWKRENGAEKITISNDEIDARVTKGIYQSDTAPNTEDAGAELTYNKRNRGKSGIKWDDIADKNMALKVKESTKQNVYPRPDYQAMIDGGMQPVIAHIVKQVYDKLAATPNTSAAPTDTDLKLYIDALNRVMAGTIQWATDNQSIAKWAAAQSRVAGAMTGGTMKISDLAQSGQGLLDIVYPGGWKNFRAEVIVLGGNKALAALQPSYDEGTRAIKAIKEGWPATQESWQKQGLRIIDGATLTAETYEGKHQDGKPFVSVWMSFKDSNRTTNIEEKFFDGVASKDDAAVQDYTKERLAELRDKSILINKNNRIVGAFDNIEAAQDAARENVKRESKNTISDKGISVESAERIGPARRMEGEDITSDRILETFGYNGLNFGNWLKGESNKAERQLHLNHIYDSGMDMAELLNVPPKALSLNGMLGIAIGAQGTGKAAAHFVPGVNEINLTRTGGAGAFVHEQAHGIDHYFAVLAGLASNKAPYLSDNMDGIDSEGYTKRMGQKVKAFGEGIRTEIVAHFKAIVKAMNERPMTQAESDARRAESKAKTQKNVDGWLKAIAVDFRAPKNADTPGEDFDRIAARIRALDLGEGWVSSGGKSYISPAVAELRDLFKKQNGHVYPLEKLKSLQANLDHLVYVNSAEAAARRAEEDQHPQTISTDYQSESQRADKDKGGKKYWSTEREMFARAFDAYITDKLAENAAKNTYLSGIEAVPPKGEERIAINKAFDGLVGEIKTRETDKGVAMYSLEEAAPQGEAAQIVAEAKKNGTYLKGPNGKDTRLTPAQWVQVRTKAFKEWFGDWEKAGKYSRLLNMQPIKISVGSLSEPAAFGIYDNLGSATNRSDNREVFFVHSIFGKLARHKEHSLIFRLIPDLKNIFEQSVPAYFEAERDQARHNNVVGFHNYVTQVRIDGQNYYVRTTIQEVKKPNGNELHSLFLSDMEIKKAGSLNSPSGLTAPFDAPTTHSTTSLDVTLSSWIKKIKADFNNASKVVDENGEPLVVYNASAGDFNIYRRRYERDGATSAKEAAAINRFGKGIFFSSDANMAGRFGSETRAFFLKIDELNDVNLGGASYFDGTLHDPETGEAYLDDNGNPVRVDQDFLPDEMAETHLDDTGGRNTGVVVRGVYENIPAKGRPVPLSDTWIVGNPAQIKSATDNVGTFDGTNPDIRYSAENAQQGEARGLQEAAQAQDQLAPPLSAPSINALVREWEKTMGGIKIREAADGSLVIETKSGQTVEVKGVEQITPDSVSLSLAYGTETVPEGKVIAGQFLSVKTAGKTAEIHLVRDKAGVWTMGHEFYHFLEEIGAISNEDKNLLNRKIRSLVERDPDTYAKLKGMSPAEQRADWTSRARAGLYDATTPTGKIIQKLKGIVDQVLNALGIRTAGGVVRDIQKGRIYDRGGIPGTRRAAGPQYSLTDKAGQGQQPTAKATTGQKAEAAWAQRVVSPVGKQASRGLAMMIGKMDPVYQEAARRMGRQLQEFWEPGSTLPGGDAWKALRAKGMGEVAKAMRFIEQLHTKLDLLSDDLKKTSYQVLDGQIPVETLPESFTTERKVKGQIVREEMNPRELARMIRRRSDTIGEMMVESGIITEAQFKAWEGKYIHHAYAYHILGEDASIAISNNGKLDLAETMHRNPNLTMEQKKQLGLIEDASIAVPMGMGKALTDIAKANFMKEISENPDWVWQDSIISVPAGLELKTPVRGRTHRMVKMTIGKLVDEVKKHKEMVAVQPSPEVEAHLKILQAALDKAEEASKKRPADFRQLKGKHYGALDGAFVRDTIYNDMAPVMGQIDENMGKALKSFLEIEAMAMSAFKMGKVALNIPTAFRNVISNIIQINMSGRPLANIGPDIWDAAMAMLAPGKIQEMTKSQPGVKIPEELRQLNQYYEEAFGMGLFHTSWAATEVNAILDEFRKAKGGKLDQVVGFLKWWATKYGKIDDIAKFTLFLQQRKEGKTVDAAAIHALKWGMDYSLASRSVKAARRHLIPFGTYMYKIAPLLAETIRDRPWVIAKYAMILPILMKAWAKSVNDLDDDDVEELEKQLPTYIKKSGSMLLLPYKTEKGQWQWLNMEYFLPWSNHFNIFRDMKERDIGELTRDIGISHPLLDLVTTFRSARDGSPPEHPFFGKPIYNQLDPAPLKVLKMMEHVAFTFVPSMLSPSFGAAGYTWDAAMGKEDRWGREVTPLQATGRWFGFNVVAVSPEQTAAIAGVKIQDKKKELARVEADPSISDERKKDYRVRLQEEIAEAAQTSPEAVLPIKKQKGEDPVFNAMVEMVRKGSLKTGPPSRSIEIAGTPYKMTLTQYREYIEKSSEIAHRKLEGLVSSPTWEAMSDKRKSEVVSGVMENARKGVRQKIKAEIARESREKTAARVAAGG